MDPATKIAFKKALKQLALDLIGQRIAEASRAVEEAQQSANQEEKSSAGDKYETGRAMGHLQKDMHSRQLAENQKELSALQAVPVEKLFGTVRPGACIQTAAGVFFISGGLGKQSWQGETVVFLSPQAPLAKAMAGKAAGDRFIFNGAQVEILEIY